MKLVEESKIGRHLEELWQHLHPHSEAKKV